jgi:uncharacterized RDD family membrane protein YckC
MKLFNPQTRRVFRLISLLCLGALAGNLPLPLTLSAAAQASENAIEPLPADTPAETQVKADENSASDEQPVRQHIGERVHIGSNLKMRADEIASDAVAVFGSTDVAGRVQGNLATVFGSSKVDGFVGENMATVFGSSKMQGRVGGNLVTVFGNADVNGSVGENLVVVFGSLRLGPNAVVREQCVAVFGPVERHPDASLASEPLEILPSFGFLMDYLRSGLLLGRPLPPGSVMAWMFVTFHFLLYFLVALILPRPTAANVRQLDSRPFLSFGVGVLILILLAPLFVILVATGAGLLLIPFVLLAETAFVILGKTAALEFIGLQVLRRFSATSDNQPVFAFLVGFILVTLLYMLPVVGGLLWLALYPLALGAAVMAVFSSTRKNGNGRAPANGIPAVGIPYSAATAPAPAAPGEAGFAAETAQQASSAMPLTSPAPQIGVLTAAQLAILPRAGFWIRLAATALDFILLVWLIPLVKAYFPLCWLAYHVAMWAWKGTTIGGIVCSLKVVRVDGRAVDFAVALVRGLASVFSAVTLLLGFFWAGWTRERQSWHDLIAGTVIVRVPRAVSLV